MAFWLVLNAIKRPKRPRAHSRAKDWIFLFRDKSDAFIKPRLKMLQLGFGRHSKGEIKMKKPGVQVGQGWINLVMILQGNLRQLNLVKR